jgi:hypothetical protein
MGITFFPREKYEALKTVFDEMQDQDQEPVGFVRIEEPGEEEAANDEAASDEEPAAGNPSEDAAKPAEADEQQPAENAEEVTPVIDNLPVDRSPSLSDLPPLSHEVQAPSLSSYAVLCLRAVAMAKPSCRTGWPRRSSAQCRRDRKGEMGQIHPHGDSA